MQIIMAYSERGQTPMNITHTILATVGSIIVMFAISKLLGNKQISQLTLFDYINGIIACVSVCEHYVNTSGLLHCPLL